MEYGINCGNYNSKKKKLHTHAESGETAASEMCGQIGNVCMFRWRVGSVVSETVPNRLKWRWAAALWVHALHRIQHFSFWQTRNTCRRQWTVTHVHHFVGFLFFSIFSSFKWAHLHATNFKRNIFIVLMKFDTSKGETHPFPFSISCSLTSSFIFSNILYTTWNACWLCACIPLFRALLSGPIWLMVNVIRQTKSSGCLRTLSNSTEHLE